MFVQLHVHSPFSFLDGAARIEELVQAAASFGMPALAITDHNGLSGAVRFHRAATEAGLVPITGPTQHPRETAVAAVLSPSRIVDWGGRARL